MIRCTAVSTATPPPDRQKIYVRQPDFHGSGSAAELPGLSAMRRHARSPQPMEEPRQCTHRRRVWLRRRNTLGTQRPRGWRLRKYDVRPPWNPWIHTPEDAHRDRVEDRRNRRSVSFCSHAPLRRVPSHRFDSSHQMHYRSWNVRNNHGGGYSYRLCPGTEPLTEECFKKHPLDFDQTKQAILFQNGTRFPIKGTFVNEGTEPAGSTWAMLPIPENGLGPRCLPGPDDTPSTPHGCEPWEGRESGHYNPKYKNGHVPGPCVPCPETPGSDCSRCDNGGADAKSPAFPPPYNGVAGAPVEGVLDVLKIPSDLQPGEYVLGWCVIAIVCSL